MLQNLFRLGLQHLSRFCQFLLLFHFYLLQRLYSLFKDLQIIHASFQLIRSFM